MKLTKIFEPITINKTEFKNRMVVSAMVTNYCNEDGTPRENEEHEKKNSWREKTCGPIMNPQN